MIIEPTLKIAQNGANYNEIINIGAPYWAVGYDLNNEIQLITPEDAPIQNRALASKYNGFGASTYHELLDEIENRGLIWPQS